MRESPHASTGSARRRRRGSCPRARPARAPPVGDAPMSGTANSYQSLSQPKWRRSGLSPGGSISARKPKVFSASGIECSFASTSTVESCSSRRLLGGGVDEPVVAERVRHDVGRHDAVDVIHQEERRAEHGAVRRRSTAPRGPARRSARRPAGSRRIDGRAGTSGTPARPRRSAPPAPPTSARPACRPPTSGPVRMMVSDDMPLESTPLSMVTSGCHPAGHHGGEPLRHDRRECGDVARGVL